MKTQRTTKQRRIGRPRSGCVILAAIGLAAAPASAQVYVDGESTVIIAGGGAPAAPATSKPRASAPAATPARDADAADDDHGNEAAPADAAVDDPATATRSAVAVVDGNDHRRGYSAASLGYVPATRARIVTRASAMPPASGAAASRSRADEAWDIDPWYQRRYGVSWNHRSGARYASRYRSPGYIVGSGSSCFGFHRPIVVRRSFLRVHHGFSFGRGFRPAHCW